MPLRHESAVARPLRATAPKTSTRWLLGVCLAVSVAWIVQDPPLRLELRSYPGETLLFASTVAKGDIFSTCIKHSVHLSPVYESYRIDGPDRIVLQSTRLQDMGWGVPSTYDQPSRIEHGFLIIEAINKVLPSLPFRVSHINQPRLIMTQTVGESEIRLDDYVPDGKRVTIRVTRASKSASLLRTFQGEIYAQPTRGATNPVVTAP